MANSVTKAASSCVCPALCWGPFCTLSLQLLVVNMYISVVVSVWLSTCCCFQSIFFFVAFNPSLISKARILVTLSRRMSSYSYSKISPGEIKTLSCQASFCSEILWLLTWRVTQKLLFQDRLSAFITTIRSNLSSDLWSQRQKISKKDLWFFPPWHKQQQTGDQHA